ncbi:MAG: rhamnogalacturonan acetylesterase [Armatimonadetes bacterium]|nr:rhamnogalacturonan acetylesterase [Armatimonadota bacterium]
MLRIGCYVLLALSAGWAQDAPQARPTIYLIGDSTVNNGTKGQMGWGTAMPPWVAADKAGLVNRARGGRSSRTFLREGLWAEVAKLLRPGDFVLMQFGHNDGGGLNDPRGRASIKGNGDETAEVTDAATGAKETVHSYGWYLRTYCQEAQAKGAVPVVLSPVPRNMWKDGKVGRSSNDYGKWAKEAAEASKAAFVDLNGLIADRYDALGEAAVAKLFGPTDHTHTLPDGARLNAECVVAGLKALPGDPFRGLLLAQPKPAE